MASLNDKDRMRVEDAVNLREESTNDLIRFWLMDYITHADQPQLHLQFDRLVEWARTFNYDNVFDKIEVDTTPADEV